MMREEETMTWCAEPGIWEAKERRRKSARARVHVTIIPSHLRTARDNVSVRKALSWLLMAFPEVELHMRKMR